MITGATRHATSPWLDGADSVVVLSGHGVAVDECLAAKEMGGDIFEIRCLPLVGYDVLALDLVRCDDDGRIQEITKKSGARGFRFRNAPDSVRMKMIEHLRDIGCAIEFSIDSDIVAFQVERECSVSADLVAGWLEDIEKRGLVDTETILLVDPDIEPMLLPRTLPMPPLLTSAESANGIAPFYRDTLRPLGSLDATGFMHRGRGRKRAQAIESQRPVAVLGPLLARNHDQSGRSMNGPYGAVGDVLVLAAGSAGAHCRKRHVPFIDGNRRRRGLEAMNGDEEIPAPAFASGGRIDDLDRPQPRGCESFGVLTP